MSSENVEIAIVVQNRDAGSNRHYPDEAIGQRPDRLAGLSARAVQACRDLITR